LVVVPVKLLVSVLLNIDVTVAELDTEPVLVAIIVLVDVGEPVIVNVINDDLVTVRVPTGDIVFFIELEEVAETVDVLLGILDLVLVIVLNAVIEINAVNVADLLIVVVLEAVVVELIVLELETDLLTELELVPVFVVVTDDVPVGVNLIDLVLIDVADMDAELDEVFEGCVDLLYVEELLCVFEIGGDRVLVGLAELVLDIKPDDVTVLEAVVVLVAVVVDVTVLDIIDESDILGEDEEVFEIVALLVEV